MQGVGWRVPENHVPEGRFDKLRSVQDRARQKVLQAIQGGIAAIPGTETRLAL